MSEDGVLNFTFQWGGNVRREEGKREREEVEGWEEKGRSAYINGDQALRMS